VSGIPQRAGTPNDRTGATQALAHGALRDVLREVERDEAEAITVLCRVLELVEKSSDLTQLSTIRNVVKEWQNRPPRGIVTGLMTVMEKLECPAPAKR